MPLNTDCQFAFYSRSSTTNKTAASTTQHHFQNNHQHHHHNQLPGGQTASTLSPRDDENGINEIRRLIREQSNLSNKVKKKTASVPTAAVAANTNSDSSDEYELPVRRFTPLPDIPRSDDVYFRTESKLLRDRGAAELPTSTGIGAGAFTCVDDSLLPFAQVKVNAMEVAAAATGFGSQTSNNKKSINHFGTKVNFSHRLPALEKQISHSIQNTMDLDEDLPMNTVQLNQRNIYTSPGDRIISPIKRPQAPSPPASAYRRKTDEELFSTTSEYGGGGGDNASETPSDDDDLII
jgi:hypothetical protein